MAAPPQRPPLNTFRPTPENATEFRRWYWLKAELVAYCKQTGLKSTGQKADIAERIGQYLLTGQMPKERQPLLGKKS
ncbi:MAG: SAP domain-containing protein, partial [Cyanobacteria bacterium P01_H01_bin.119]